VIRQYSAANYCALAPCGRGQRRWLMQTHWVRGLFPQAEVIERWTLAEADPFRRFATPSPTVGEGKLPPHLYRGFNFSAAELMQ
jgi:hypothetical protein